MDIFQLDRKKQCDILYEILDLLNKYSKLDSKRDVLIGRLNSMKNWTYRTEKITIVLLVCYLLYIESWFVEAIDKYALTRVSTTVIGFSLLFGGVGIRKLIIKIVSKVEDRRRSSLSTDIFDYDIKITVIKSDLTKIRNKYSVPNEFFSTDSLMNFISYFDAQTSLYDAYKICMRKWDVQNKNTERTTRVIQENTRRAENDKKNKEVLDKLDEIRKVEQAQYNMMWKNWKPK